jgi:hypothetical protein
MATWGLGGSGKTAGSPIPTNSPGGRFPARLPFAPALRDEIAVPDGGEGAAVPEEVSGPEDDPADDRILGVEAGEADGGPDPLPETKPPEGPPDGVPSGGLRCKVSRLAARLEAGIVLLAEPPAAGVYFLA